MAGGLPAYFNFQVIVLLSSMKYQFSCKSWSFSIREGKAEVFQRWRRAVVTARSAHVPAVMENMLLRLMFVLKVISPMLTLPVFD